MKKFFSISFTFLIVLSGMHLSIGTHICGGEVAAVKWSFSEKKASCGMEDDNTNSPNQTTIATNCCHNQLAIYIVDNHYNLSSIEYKGVTENILQLFNDDFNTSFISFIPSNSVITYINPPGNRPINDVSLADICVFRI